MIHEDEFRLLFEAAPNGMIVVDQAGAIVSVNAQTEKLFGYSRGELVGQAVELLIPEQFRTTHAALRDQFEKNRQPRPMGAGRDLCGRRRDGSEFPAEIGINPFRSGDRALVIASVVDISERKRNEEHVRFIMNELSHRSKNLLMVVLAIAKQTVKRVTSFGEFQKQFEGRIMAIARCHDLLVKQGWLVHRSKLLFLLSLNRSRITPLGSMPRARRLCFIRKRSSN
jgi:PAS domain S-box-containing protein